MRQPTFGERIMGFIPVSVLLLAFSGFIIFGWAEGQLSGWYALGATLLALRTFGAIGAVRGHKHWRASWDAMQSDNAGQERPSGERKRFPCLRLFAAFYVVAMPMASHVHTRYVLNFHAVMAVMLFWFAAIVYLLFVAIRGAVRGWKQRHDAKTAKALERQREKEKDAPVTMLTERRYDSPSREEAERALPEYCRPPVTHEES